MFNSSNSHFSSNLMQYIHCSNNNKSLMQSLNRQIKIVLIFFPCHSIGNSINARGFFSTSKILQMVFFSICSNDTASAPMQFSYKFFTCFFLLQQQQQTKIAFLGKKIKLAKSRDVRCDPMRKFQFQINLWQREPIYKSKCIHW